MSDTTQHSALLGLTAQIVAAHVQNNQVEAAELPGLIQQVFSALSQVGQAPKPAEPEKSAPVPVVPARKSVFHDYIICLEDGRKLKTLKRYLRSTYNLTPEQYREKWGLAPDYPMVAPSYAEKRSALAKQLGLGRKSGSSKAKPEAVEDDDELDLVLEAELEEAADDVVHEAEDITDEVPPEPKRSDLTAASVFSRFPAAQPQPELEEPAETAPVKKTRRKPFSKQLARTMRR